GRPRSPHRGPSPGRRRGVSVVTPRADGADIAPGRDYHRTSSNLRPDMTARPSISARTVDAGPVQQAMAEVGRRIVGQEMMVERLLVGLLTGGHILIEGVPGLAKTLAVKTLAEVVEASFSRIQFTPDLLPADLIGTMIFDPKSQEFRVKKGP